MPEPKKKRPLAHKALPEQDSMAPSQHPDEGVVKRDFVSAGYQDEVSIQDAANEVKRSEHERLKGAVLNDAFGRRTFPSAVNAGYATPTYRSTQEIQARASREKRSIGQPFFTDPGSGEVDLNQAPHPYVFASTTANDRMDRSTWPATINPQAFTGNKMDPFGADVQMARDVERREAARKDKRDEKAQASNPIKTIIGEILYQGKRLLDRKPSRLIK